MKKTLFTAVLLLTFIKLAFCQGNEFAVEVAQKEISLISSPYDLFFHVQFQVFNTSGREQTIYLWSCGDTESWKTDNSLIIPSIQECYNHYIFPKVLRPGEKLKQEVDFLVSKRGYSGDITFRAGFIVTKNPDGHNTEKGEMYWSSPITIRIQSVSPTPKVRSEFR